MPVAARAVTSSLPCWHHWPTGPGDHDRWRVHARGRVLACHPGGCFATPGGSCDHPTSIQPDRGSGAAVGFSVTAMGTAPLTYQWRKNGVNLAGETDATLSLATCKGLTLAVMTWSWATLGIYAQSGSNPLCTQSARRSVGSACPVTGTTPLTGAVALFPRERLCRYRQARHEPYGRPLNGNPLREHRVESAPTGPFRRQPHRPAIVQVNSTFSLTGAL